MVDHARWRDARQLRIFILTCKLGRDMSHSTMDITQIDALLDWKLNRWNEAKTKMQDQITIELRVDFADKDKIPELINIACAAAQHMVANVMLLQPVTKPECVVFTDNFMAPPKKIDIYSNLIKKGQEELATIARSGVSGAVTAEVTDTIVPSDELFAAMRG